MFLFVSAIDPVLSELSSKFLLVCYADDLLLFANINDDPELIKS